MKKFSSLVLGVGFAALPSLSFASMEDVTTYIINGSGASTSTYSTFVSLYTDKRNASGYGQYSSSSFCGGAILDSTHILTAAHCIFDGSGSLDDTAQYIAVVQTDSVVDLGTTSLPVYSVNKLYYRDDYYDNSSTLWVNDIAILEVSEEMNTSASTTLVSDDSSYQDDSEEFIAVGFGTTTNDEDDEGSSSLLQTTLIYDSCGSDSRVTTSHICFDGDIPTGETLKNATCSGDSGGPIYWNDGGYYRQVGIVSFGPTVCGDPDDDYVTGTTEISDYSNWISAVQSGDLESGTYECTISSGINCTQPSGSGSISVSDSTSVSGSISASSEEAGSVPLWSSLFLLVAALLRRRL